ncbi:hypothetical protein RB653_000259 [Dictyostelium firmibasis]|uniref:Pseudouridine synthase I TruA alpha/beta domain-containing protein n=1 Tax=Dictyostelium firmibasis TaxID=79012 RepID=A0AAN7TUZ7_9MYCE
MVEDEINVNEQSDSPNNTTTTTNSSFLQFLPTSGSFSKYNAKKPGSTQTIPKYIAAHNTNPPNDEFVKNEENNILIRSLTKNSVNKRINEQSPKSKRQKNINSDINDSDNDNDNDSGDQEVFSSEIEDFSPNKRTRNTNKKLLSNGTHTIQIRNYLTKFKGAVKTKIDLNDVFENRQFRGKKKEEPKKMFVNKADRYQSEVVIVEKKPIENSKVVPLTPLQMTHAKDLNDFYYQHKEEIDKNILGKSKKPMLLCFAYNGTDYYGLSYNKDINFISIENIIEKVLFRNGHISISNVGDPKRIKFSRSSRTDKGVHSLSTVISCYLLVDEATENSKLDVPQHFIDNINRYLPDNIRLIGASRPTRQFRARRANGRTYHYMVPADHLQGISIDYMNKILSKYIGINSFHNYTYQRLTYLDSSKVNILDDNCGEEEEEDKPNEDNFNYNIQKQLEKEEQQNSFDARAIKIDRIAEKQLFRRNSVNNRHIHDFYVEKNTVEFQGKQWYRFVISGESFIMYQIRKMMGFFLAVVKGHQPEIAIDLSLKSPFSISSPTAPAFPLYLSSVKFCEENGEEKIILPNTIKPIRNKFLNAHLMPEFDKIESETNQFINFFNYLSEHYYRLDDIDELIELNKEYQERIAKIKADIQKKKLINIVSENESKKK